MGGRARARVRVRVGGTVRARVGVRVGGRVRVRVGCRVDRDEDDADGEEGHVAADGDRSLAIQRAGRDWVDGDHVRLPAHRVVGGGPLEQRVPLRLRLRLRLRCLGRVSIQPVRDT